MDIPRPPTRVCSVCREDLPLNGHYFHRDNAGHGGFQYTCKRCKIAARTQAYKRNPALKSAQDRRRQQRLRLAALNHYSSGRPSCVCCGDTHIEFLAVDHINGGATLQGGSGTRLYRWLKTHGYPDGFRVLCHNCNQALAYYGYCPHQLANLIQ